MESDRIADIIVITVIILLFIFRICGLITWPWIWMLAPIWIPFGIGLFLAVFMIIVFIIAYLRGDIK